MILLSILGIHVNTSDSNYHLWKTVLNGLANSIDRNQSLGESIMAYRPINNYPAVSKHVQSILTIAEISALWKASELGNPSKESTIKRWLNVGPETKNPRFEPFVAGLSVALKVNRVDKERKKVHTVADKIKWLLQSNKLSVNETAMISGFEAYSLITTLSNKQLSLLDKTFDRYQ